MKASCPKDGVALKTVPIDERTAKQFCPQCGYSQIIEAADADGSRHLLTDDMGPGGPGRLNG